MLFSVSSFARDRVEKVRYDAENKVKQIVLPLLNKHCLEACELIGIKILVEKTLPPADEIGFEGLSFEKGQIESSYDQFQVESATISIQVDRKVNSVEKSKLSKLLTNSLVDIALSSKVEWFPVDIPEIGKLTSDIEAIRVDLKSRLQNIILNLIADYCPSTCILSEISIEGKEIGADDIVGLQRSEYIKSNVNSSYFKVDTIDLVLTFDNKMSDFQMTSFIDLLKAKTAFIRNINIKIKKIDFPVSFSEQERQKRADSADPFGLEKLRRMLVLFRDLAGTKEIISTSSAKESLASESLTHLGEYYWVYFLVLVFILGFFLFLFKSSIGKDARFLITTASGLSPASNNTDSQNTRAEDMNNASAGGSDSNTLSLEFRNKKIKDDLIAIFIKVPKVARETFGRLIQEDGIEESAKYISIFGKVILYELFEDPNFSRDLFELSEYYHRSDIKISLDEEFKLLEKIKNRVTANEIKILAQKNIDDFDFLNKLDTSQIFALIGDESPRVQSIILTQLNPRQRSAMFNLFIGEDRVTLMNELCKADSIPKEYLSNVALALSQKVSAKPEFDTQNLRASEILLDLLERSPLDEQKKIMSNLIKTNKEAARAIKLKLITVQMLPYLKDGHLLELVLGLERDILLTFLAGSPEHIRELLLSHAPKELSESWLEDLESVQSVEESQYRVSEMMILGRVRGLATAGSINILEINDLIFDPSNNEEDKKSDDFEKSEKNIVA